MQPRRPPGGFRTRRPNKATSYSRRGQRTMGHEWGQTSPRGSLPTSAPCVLTKTRRAPRPCRAGSESSWKTWNLTSPFAPHRRVAGGCPSGDGLFCQWSGGEGLEDAGGYGVGESYTNRHGSIRKRSSGAIQESGEKIRPPTSAVAFLRPRHDMRRGRSRHSGPRRGAPSAPAPCPGRASRSVSRRCAAARASYP